MKSILFVLCTLVLSLALNARAFTIAEAKALPLGTNVTVGPFTLSTVQDITFSGYACAGQDATGGATLYGSTALSLINNSNFVAGDSITIKARTAEYGTLFELDTISLVQYNGFGGVPAPTIITIQDMQSGAPSAEAYESMLVQIADVQFTSAGTFGSGINYQITNLTDNLGTTVRIQDSTDPLAGTSIPQGPVTIIGILSAYFSGPQLLPLQIITEAPQDDPDLVVDTNLLFGIVYDGYPRTFNLKVDNGGRSNDLLLTGFSGATAQFAVLSNAFPYTIAPGGYMLLAMQYTGSAPGATDSATLQLQSNDPSDPSIAVTFSGAMAAGAPAPVWINEFDYDTPGSWSTEMDEYIELCGIAGTSISNWQLRFWDGFAVPPSNYASFVIGSTIGGFTFQDEDNGFGFYVLGSSDSIHIPTDEIAPFGVFENRSPVAVQLLDAEGNQVHFAEFGSYWASNFRGDWPDDITSYFDGGISNRSLSYVGVGLERLDFAWDYNITNSPGTTNIGQTLPEPVVPVILFAAALLGLLKR